MAAYDYRTITVVNSTPSSAILLFRPRRGRVSMAFNAPNPIAPGFNQIELIVGGEIQATIWGSLAPDFQLFTYRDFGPLVEDGWFFQAGANVATVTATEVWKVPNT